MSEVHKTENFRRLRGNAWVLSSIEAARAVYQTALEKLLPRGNSEDWSLVTSLFERKATLVFLWGPDLDPEVAAAIEKLAKLAGGQELEEQAKRSLLAQILARRAALEIKEPFETLMIHHPRGKVWWDLSDP